MIKNTFGKNAQPARAASKGRLKVAKSGAKPNPSAITESHINGSFNFKYLKPKSDAAFEHRLIAFTVLIALLPVIYFLSVSYLAIATLTYAVESNPFTTESFSILYTIFYIVWVAAGVLLSFFMLRPLFPNLQSNEIDIELAKTDEPLFFHFMEVLCEKVGCPPLKKISVTMEANARFTLNGFVGLFVPSTHLRVGLPLVSCLSMTHFVALLSHEAGHFANKRVRVCYSIVSMIRNWCHRNTDGSDGWEEFIENADSEYNNPMQRLLILLCKVGLVLPVLIIKGIMFVVDKLINVVADEVEFNADRYANVMVGARSYAEALKYTNTIVDAYDSSVHQSFYTESKRIDNFLVLIKKTLNAMPQQILRHEEFNLTEQYNNWSMHPPLQERLQELKKKPYKGVFKIDKPVSILFKDMDEIAKNATLMLYRHHGLPIGKEDLRSSVINSVEKRKAVSVTKSLNLFTNSAYVVGQSWILPSFERLRTHSRAQLVELSNKSIVSLRGILPEILENQSTIENIVISGSDHLFYEYMEEEGNSLPEKPDMKQQSRKLLALDEFKRGPLEKYRRLCGTRVALASFLVKDTKSFTQNKILLKLLGVLGSLQLTVDDAILQRNALEKILERRYKFNEKHHRYSINTSIGNVNKACVQMERKLAKFPSELLNGLRLNGDITHHKIEDEKFVSKESRYQLIKYFDELVHYYNSYNVAVATRLAKMTMQVEQDHGIQALKIASVRLKKP